MKILKTPAGVTVFDMGQNMVGWVRLKVQRPRGHDGHAAPRRDARRGRHVLHGQPAGARSRPSATPSRAAARRPTSRTSPSTASATSRSTGWPGEPTLDSLTGVVVHSDMPRDRRASSARTRCSTSSSTTSSGARRATSSTCPPTARSATSASAGRATRRCSRAPPPSTWTWPASSPSGWATSRPTSTPNGSVPHVVPDVLSSAAELRGRLGGLGATRP